MDRHDRNMVTIIASHYSYKIPEIINLKRGNICFGLHFGGFRSWSVGSADLEGEGEQQSWQEHGLVQCLTSWWPRSKETRVPQSSSGPWL